MATSIRKDSRGHRFTVDNLSAYLDGEMSANDDARIKAHLALCESCRRDAATLRMTRQLLRQAPRQPLPRSFALSSSAIAEQKSYRRWSLAQSWLRTASAIVSVLLVVLLSGDVILSQGWLAPQMVPSAPQAEIMVRDMAQEQIQEPLLDAQSEPQTIEMAPMMGAAEAELAPPPVPEVSAGTKAVTESQPMIAKAMAEPQAVAEGTVEESVAGSGAAQAPAIRAMPKSSSAAPPDMGGGEVAPEQEAQPAPEQPQAAGERQALGAEQATVEQPIARAAAPAAAPDDQAPAVPAGKLGLPTSVPVEDKAVLMTEPNPQKAGPVADEPLLYGESNETSERAAAPGNGYVQLWRTIRIASLLTLGLLLMLVAGLLLVIQKRRV